MNAVEVPVLRPLQGFPVLFGWGLRRTLRGRKFLIVSIVGAFAFYGLGILTRRAKDPTYELWDFLDIVVLGLMVPLVALAFVGGGFGEEVADRTLLYHLVRPVRRSTLYVARYGAGLVPGAGVVVVMTFATWVGNGSRVGVGTVATLAAIAALGVATLGAVYYAMAALFRRGLIAGLVYTFLLEGLFQFLPGSVQKLSLTFHVRSLAHRATDDAFAVLSQTVASKVAWLERQSQDVAVEKMFGSSAREPWTEPTTVGILCVIVVLGACLLGARAVERRDFPLKD